MGKNSDPERGPPRLGHMTAEEYLRLGYLSADEFDGLLRFSVVRNPWSRLVSEYRWMYEGQIGFRSFVLENMPTQADDNHETGQDSYRHVLPQCAFLYAQDGTRLVERLLPFENLASGFAALAQELGLRKTVLPVVNRKRRGTLGAVLERRLPPWMRPKEHKVPWRSYYDDETLSAVAEFYRDDIDRLGYSFDADHSSTL